METLSQGNPKIIPWEHVILPECHLEKKRCSQLHPVGNVFPNYWYLSASWCPSLLQPLSWDHRTISAVRAVGARRSQERAQELIFLFLFFSYLLCKPGVSWRPVQVGASHGPPPALLSKLSVPSESWGLGRSCRGGGRWYRCWSPSSPAPRPTDLPNHSCSEPRIWQGSTWDPCLFWKPYCARTGWRITKHWLVSLPLWRHL